MSDTVFDANKIHETDRPPSGCAACYGQYPDRRHVDFGASYDGPMIPSTQNVAGGLAVSIDDLVLCEECVKAGANALGYVDASAIEGQRDRALEDVDTLAEKLAGAMRYIDMLEKQVNEKQTFAEAMGVEIKNTPKPRVRQ